MDGDSRVSRVARETRAANPRGIAIGSGHRIPSDHSQSDAPRILASAPVTIHNRNPPTMSLTVDRPVRPFAPADVDSLSSRLASLQPTDDVAPDISVVVPVNAMGDLGNVVNLLHDIADYRGPYSLEVVLLVNNYPATVAPAEIDELRRLGVQVKAVPDVREPGYAVVFSARMQGIRAAKSQFVVVFDADNRLSSASDLINWYGDRLREGASAAYTPVAFCNFPDVPSLHTRFFIHHASRWVKRSLFGIPTTQGANYAVRREAMLELYDAGLLADDINVGPTFKRMVGPVSYSGKQNHVVYTSARMFRVGWKRIIPYYIYRLRYNLRVLPVRAGVAGRTGRENDPVRRYDEENRPIRT